MDKLLDLMKKELGRDNVVSGVGRSQGAAYRDASKKLPDGKTPDKYEGGIKRLDDTVNGINVCYLAFNEKKKKKKKPPTACGGENYRNLDLGKF